METHATERKSLHPLVWIAGIAVAVFSVVGTGAFMGWIPTSMSGPADKAILESQQGNAVAKARVPAAPAPRAAPVHVAAAIPPAAIVKCAECGVVESVNEVEVKGDGTGLGAVGGAVVGGVLGSQVGGGDGKKVMTVVGAVGGAIAGNEVEKRVKTTKSYSITVRLDDGTTRVVSQAAAPSWRAGDKVKVINGAIQSNG